MDSTIDGWRKGPVKQARKLIQGIAQLKQKESNMQKAIPTDGWALIGTAPFVLQQFSGETLYLQPAAAQPLPADKGEGSLRIEDHSERNITFGGDWWGRMGPVDGPAKTENIIVVGDNV